VLSAVDKRRENCFIPGVWMKTAAALVTRLALARRRAGPLKAVGWWLKRKAMAVVRRTPRLV
jgi:hypothetical protein